MSASRQLRFVGFAGRLEHFFDELQKNRVRDCFRSGFERRRTARVRRRVPRRAAYLRSSDRVRRPRPRDRSPTSGYRRSSRSSTSRHFPQGSPVARIFLTNVIVRGAMRDDRDRCGRRISPRVRSGRAGRTLFRRFFPPPAAVALVLVRTDRPRAGLAADAHETGVVQRVVRHVVGADVGPHVGGRPARERIEFDDAVIDASKTPRRPVRAALRCA